MKRDGNLEAGFDEIKRVQETCRRNAGTDASNSMRC